MAPSASDLLETVRGRTLERIAKTGINGVVRTMFLYLLAVGLGFVGIVQGFFDAVIAAAFDLPDAIFNGIANLISTGFALTADGGFFLADYFPALGFLEGLVYAFVTIFVLQQFLEFFGTDVFFIPGFDFIPFIGNEADGDEGQ